MREAAASKSIEFHVGILGAGGYEQGVKRRMLETVKQIGTIYSILE